MPYTDLRSFIADLKQRRELVEISEPASVDQEIACAADRVSKLPGGGPALLFSNVKECKTPVLINALGGERRLSLVCGVNNFVGLQHRLADLLETLQTPRKSLIDKLKALPLLKQLSGDFPKYVKRGPCQEVVHTGDAIDLTKLPVLKTWPEAWRAVHHVSACVHAFPQRWQAQLRHVPHSDFRQAHDRLSRSHAPHGR